MVCGMPGDTEGLAQVMVEREKEPRDIRQIGRDIVGRHFDLTVLHVLRVDKQNPVDHVEFFKKDRADKTVEVAAGNQTIIRHRASPIALQPLIIQFLP